MKTPFLFLLLTACTREPSPEPCPKCERCAEIPVTILDAGPAEVPKPQWRTVTDFSRVLGEWSSVTDRVKVEKRPGSKTPYNVQFVAPGIEGGCGFYDTGTAFCSYAQGKTTVTSKETLVAFHLLDESNQMRFSASGIVAATVTRYLP